MITHYDILKVTQNASTTVISAAYEALCKKYHPDNYQDEAKRSKAASVIKRLNVAHSVLSDAEKRKIYDESIGISAKVDVVTQPEINNKCQKSESIFKQVDFRKIKNAVTQSVGNAKAEIVHSINENIISKIDLNKVKENLNQSVESAKTLKAEIENLVHENVEKIDFGKIKTNIGQSVENTKSEIQHSINENIISKVDLNRVKENLNQSVESAKNLKVEIEHSVHENVEKIKTEIEHSVEKRKATQSAESQETLKNNEHQKRESIFKINHMPIKKFGFVTVFLLFLIFIFTPSKKTNETVQKNTTAELNQKTNSTNNQLPTNADIQTFLKEIQEYEEAMATERNRKMEAQAAANHDTSGSFIRTNDIKVYSPILGRTKDKNIIASIVRYSESVIFHTPLLNSTESYYFVRIYPFNLETKKLLSANTDAELLFCSKSWFQVKERTLFQDKLKNEQLNSDPINAIPYASKDCGFVPFTENELEEIRKR